MARLRYIHETEKWAAEQLAALKAKFRELGWDENFVQSVTIEDAHLIDFKAEERSFENMKGANDWVTEAGDTLLPWELSPHGNTTDAFTRPASKIVRFAGKSVKVSFFHDGSICSVEEV